MQLFCSFTVAQFDMSTYRGKAVSVLTQKIGFKYFKTSCNIINIASVLVKLIKAPLPGNVAAARKE